MKLSQLLENSRLATSDTTMVLSKRYVTLKVINSLKKKKDAGLNRTRAELFKCGGEETGY